MSRFKQQPPGNEAGDGAEPAASAPTRIIDLSEIHAPVPDTSGERQTETDTDTDTATPEVARPNVGEHVEMVLKAAEDAAENLVKEARIRAIAIRDDAERDATTRLDAANATAARLTAEAEAAHTEALASAERVRAAAEGDAVAQRAEAEEEAARLRADAEREAATFAERTQARHEELMNDTALAEDRLRRLVSGLRDVANRLDGLLGPEADEQPAPISAVADEREPASLDEALDPTQPTTTTSLE
jgi:hypothetical protein